MKNDYHEREEFRLPHKDLYASATKGLIDQGDEYVNLTNSARSHLKSESKIINLPNSFLWDEPQTENLFEIPIETLAYKQLSSNAENQNQPQTKKKELKEPDKTQRIDFPESKLATNIDIVNQINKHQEFIQQKENIQNKKKSHDY